jgi:hypothetical protein
VLAGAWLRLDAKGQFFANFRLRPGSEPLERGVLPEFGYGPVYERDGTLPVAHLDGVPNRPSDLPQPSTSDKLGAAPAAGHRAQAATPAQARARARSRRRERRRTHVGSGPEGDAMSGVACQYCVKVGKHDRPACGSNPHTGRPFVVPSNTHSSALEVGTCGCRCLPTRCSP